MEISDEEFEEYLEQIENEFIDNYFNELRQKTVVINLIFSTHNGCNEDN